MAHEEMKFPANFAGETAVAKLKSAKPKDLDTQQIDNKKNIVIDFKKSETIDKSNNGKFDLSEAGINFFKGIVSPLKAIIDHPCESALLIGATVALCSLLPPVGTALAIGFGAYSLYETARGGYDVYKNYRDGKFDEAEKSFNSIGSGTAGIALSALGVKSGAKVAKEAKLMSELKVNKLTPQQQAEIAQSVKDAKFVDNFKESMSLFTTKKGIKSTIDALEQSRYRENAKFIKKISSGDFTKEVERKISMQKPREERIVDFKKSPEGLRRAALSDEQIQKEAQALFDQAFDKLNVPKEQHPKLRFVNGQDCYGGSYNQNYHEIEFNPKSHKAGSFEMEDVIMHEGTHCKEALLRASIPEERCNEIVKNELINRILNGESEKIIAKVSFLGPIMMRPPKMNFQMKRDFIEFAKKYLYNKETSLDSNLNAWIESKRCTQGTGNLTEVEKALDPLLKQLNVMLKTHPDFVKQYDSENAALLDLAQYALSHHIRFRMCSNNKINVEKFSTKYLEIEPATGETLKAAEQSLIDFITTLEGNCRTSGLNGMFDIRGKGFTQYQFSPEEVLAEKNGNNFLIEKMTTKINEMKNAGTLTSDQQSYMEKIIEKAKLVIEYKNKGLDYYKKYTQMINNPEDAKLATTVKEIEKELEVLKNKMTPIEYTEVKMMAKVLGVPNHNSFEIPSSAIYQIIDNKDKNNNWANINTIFDFIPAVNIFKNIKQ